MIHLKWRRPAGEVVGSKAPITRVGLVLVAALVTALSARAQSDTGTSTTSTSTTTSDDLSTFQISGGTPGSWVQAAISRHEGLIAARVTAARNGETPGVRTDSSGTSDTTGTSTTTADDSSTSLNDLSTLLSEYADSLGSVSSLFGSTSSTSSSKSASTAKNAASGLAETTADDRPFPLNLVDDLLDYISSPDVLEFQATDFIQSLRQQLRGILLPAE